MYSMDRKKIIIFTSVLFAALLGFLSVKNYFQQYFSSIEKKQDEMMVQLKAMKSNKDISPTQTENTPFSLVQEVGKMKEDIREIKDELANREDVLGLLDNTSQLSPTPTKTLSAGISFVTISSNTWQTVDVFAEKNSSSKIVGQAVYGSSYPYTKKEGGYYYIELSQNVSGWIHSQFVKEY